MFPIKAEQLALTDIADYWAREIKPRATQAELLTTLAKAWFGGELKSGGRQNRLDLLRKMFKSTQDDLVFLVGDEPGPAELQELEDGGALVDPRPRVKVPSSNQKNWTEEECSDGFAVIAEQWSPDWDIEECKVFVPSVKVVHGEFYRWLETQGYAPAEFWRKNMIAAPLEEPKLPLHQSGGQSKQKYSKAKLDAAYRDYLAEKTKEGGTSPNREQDLAAMKELFPDVGFTAVRDLRRRLAPREWTERGRRPQKQS